MNTLNPSSSWLSLERNLRKQQKLKHKYGRLNKRKSKSKHRSRSQFRSDFSKNPTCEGTTRRLKWRVRLIEFSYIDAYGQRVRSATPSDVPFTCVNTRNAKDVAVDTCVRIHRINILFRTRSNFNWVGASKYGSEAFGNKKPGFSGFHEIKTWMLQINLSDSANIIIIKSDSIFSRKISCIGSVLTSLFPN